MRQKGQIMLIMLLVSAIVMVIGMTISKRTITGIKIDSDTEKQKQAFNAAESGLNYFIQTENTSYTSGKIQARIIPASLSTGAGETLAFSGAEAEMDLNGYGGSKIKICLKNKSAAEADYFYSDGSQIKIKRYDQNNFIDGCLELTTTDTPKYVAVRLKKQERR